jgi:hypothetical protein
VAHKKQRAGKVPPANRSGGEQGQAAQEGQQTPAEGAPFQEQDPNRRLGNSSGAGEHPSQQPGGLNDADH